MACHSEAEEVGAVVEVSWRAEVEEAAEAAVARSVILTRGSHHYTAFLLLPSFLFCRS